MNISETAIATNAHVVRDNELEYYDRHNSRPSRTAAAAAALEEEPPCEKRLLFPKDYTPNENDVLCGRGKAYLAHPGNIRFRKLVNGMIDAYSSANTKAEKSSILSEIVGHVRQSGYFLKIDTTTGRWYDVGDYLAREKTSQAFRDALHDRYKSSNTSKKKKKRKAEQSLAKLSKVARTRIAISTKMERLSTDIQHVDSDTEAEAMFTKANSDILAILNKAAAEQPQSCCDLPDSIYSVSYKIPSSSPKTNTAPPPFGTTPLVARESDQLEF